MRPFQAGRLVSADGSFDQLTATKTISALAASSRVPALIDGPSVRTRSVSETGPRLLAMVAAIPARDSARAKAEPILPDPVMPMVTANSFQASHGTGSDRMACKELRGLTSEALGPLEGHEIAAGDIMRRRRTDRPFKRRPSSGREAAAPRRKRSRWRRHDRGEFRRAPWPSPGGPSRVAARSPPPAS